MELRDQLGRKLLIPRAPQRIISLVPSITELLFDLELEECLCGRTSFCTEPKGKIEKIPVVGGTKTADPSVILSLNPDLVIANKEENTEQLIREISESVPTYISDIISIEDAMEMIQQIGLITEREELARTMEKRISQSLGQLEEEYSGTGKSVVYFVWSNPLMVAGSSNFIDSMLRKSGLVNLGSQLGERYPRCTSEEIISLSPDILILSSEPYRFTEKHRREWQDLIPLATVILADATYFSWYGSRLRHSAEYISALLSPQT